MVKIYARTGAENGGLWYTNIHNLEACSGAGLQKGKLYYVLLRFFKKIPPLQATGWQLEEAVQLFFVETHEGGGSKAPISAPVSQLPEPSVGPVPCPPPASPGNPEPTDRFLHIKPSLLS